MAVGKKAPLLEVYSFKDISSENLLFFSLSSWIASSCPSSPRSHKNFPNDVASLDRYEHSQLVL